MRPEGLGSSQAMIDLWGLQRDWLALVWSSHRNLISIWVCPHVGKMSHVPSRPSVHTTTNYFPRGKSFRIISLLLLHFMKNQRRPNVQERHTSWCCIKHPSAHRLLLRHPMFLAATTTTAAARTCIAELTFWQRLAWQAS